MSLIKIGLIGAGSAMQLLHLPAIAASGMASVSWIVDVNRDVAKRVARDCHIPLWGGDYRDVPDVDAVIIGTPHYLHVPMVEYFLEKKVHVLCEKPLALALEDGKRLVALAGNRNLVLAVGVFRRFYKVSHFVREAIATEWLGRIIRIDAEEGDVGGWAPQSRFIVEKDKAGGGVLVDTGSHTIDRLLWWFGSPVPKLVTYKDNTDLCVESDCVVDFHLPWGEKEIPVRVELSRTRRLRNTFQIFMENGMIEVPANASHSIKLFDNRLQGKSTNLEPITIDFSEYSGIGALSVDEAFVLQINEFCRCIANGGIPENDGMTCLPTIGLIETCYACREEMDEPWVQFETDVRFLKREAV